MKIAIAQQNYHIGNFEQNTNKIIAAIESAKQQNADLVVFSELSICGYPPRDFLEFEDFILKCQLSLEEIKKHTDNIGVLVGGPSHNPELMGKDLFNTAFFLYDQKIIGSANKTLLPTYDIFDEDRYFEPAHEWNVIGFKDVKIAVTICEDIWNLGDNPLYTICPMDELAKQQPDIMINLSASPFDYTHAAARQAIVKANVEKYKIPMVYCNTVGSQTEIVFDGASIAMNANADIVHLSQAFQEELFYVNFDGKNLTDNIEISEKEITNHFETPQKLIATDNTEEIYQALVTGIRDYFQKMGFTKAILGSSGGIDSAVSIAIACEAIGSENVRAILMPSEYSTSHSVSDAEQLSKNLNNPYDIVPIKNIYESFLTELSPIFKNLPFSVAEENIQARTRGNLLMAIANKFGYILLNTSNKSELSTGYGTLYGDMAGGLSILGDCYKTQVYALAKYINREKEIIPDHIITKAPSAELRPNQKDSDSLPDYDILDQILYQYIEMRQGPNEIKHQGFETALVDRTLKMVNVNEYKRNQFCPIIRISPKAYGVGRRVPIVGKYLS